MATFRKIEIEIYRKSGYGQYELQANYKGKKIKAHTTDAECFDYLDDDSNKAKHAWAKRYAYGKIVEAYKNSL